jgi:F0F1-type ATP synthase membrane subunit a
MKLNKIQNSILAMVILVVIFLFAHFNSEKNKNKILSDMQVVSEKVYESFMSHRGGVLLKYSFL